MKTFFKIVLLSFGIYLFSWFFVYKSGVNTLAIQSEDTIPAVFLPVTLIKEKTFYVDSYYDMIINRYPHPDDKEQAEGLTPFYLRKVSKTPDRGFVVKKVNAQTLLINYKNTDYNYISAFPVMAGILALPVYLLPLLAGVPITWESLAVLSHTASALIVALAGGFLYLLLKNQIKLSQKTAITLTGVYLFGTINYALISQALWTQGALQLFTILSLLFLYKFFAQSNKFSNSAQLSLYLSGFFIGFALISRPTAAIYIPFFLILVYQLMYRSPIKFARSSFFYFLGMAPAFLFFAWYNSKYFLGFANQGYVDQASVGWLSNLPEGFLGLWLSPSKGILVYSPVLVFSLVGLFIALRSGFKEKSWDLNLKYLLFGGIILLHTLILGKWKHWYGGWSYGYRMASDVLPFFILLLIPFAESKLFNKFKKAFLVLFGYSILVQVLGIVFFDGVWHAAYDDGYQNTGWLWSVRNSEMAFNLRRGLVKFGLLEKACPECLPLIQN